MSRYGTTFGRSDRAAGLFARDRPSTVEPPVSAPEAGACNAPRVPEYPWRVWLAVLDGDEVELVVLGGGELLAEPLGHPHASGRRPGRSIR